MQHTANSIDTATRTAERFHGATYLGRGNADRRVHRVLVTKNTEYHVRRRVCIAVRDRQTGTWYEHHGALSLEVAGGLRFYDHGGIHLKHGFPDIGDCLYFEDTNIVTTPIVDIRRPEKEIVYGFYPSN